MVASRAMQPSTAEAKLTAWVPDPQLPGWFNETRRRAIEAYFSGTLPDRSDPRWHYGSAQDFALTDLDLAVPQLEEDEGEIQQVTDITGHPADSFILMMSGTSVRSLHTTPQMRDYGVKLFSFRDALEYSPDLIQPYWEKPADFGGDRLQAARRALPENGFFLYVPRGIHLPDPIHLAVVSNRPGVVDAPCVLIILDEESRADVYLHLLGNNAAEPNLVFNVLEAHLGRQAELVLTTTQNLGPSTNALLDEKILLARDATLRKINVNLGGRRLRSEVYAGLLEPGGCADLLGMHMLRGKERFDFHTTQDHVAPRCRSNLLFKGAMLGRSKASYQGIINVAPEAQKTDAYQSNRSLLLSPQARVESSPQLEINANDVKCSHGSSVANVSPEAIFYLMSRGIDEQNARHLLVGGFLREVSGRIGQGTVKEYINDRILEQMA